MNLEQLQSLNDDEISMLWYIVNKLTTPIISGIELEPTLFTSIDNRTLIDRVVQAQSSVTEAALPIYDSLKLKMGIS
jgi:hypothetical protein